MATVELTNTSGESHAFKVQVGFFSDGEPVGREVFDSTGSLDDGEQTSLDLIGFTEPVRLVQLSGDRGGLPRRMRGRPRWGRNLREHESNDLLSTGCLIRLT